MQILYELIDITRHGSNGNFNNVVQGYMTEISIMLYRIHDACNKSIGFWFWSNTPMHWTEHDMNICIFFYFFLSCVGIVLDPMYQSTRPKPFAKSIKLDKLWSCSKLKSELVTYQKKELYSIYLFHSTNNCKLLLLLFLSKIAIESNNFSFPFKK